MGVTDDLARRIRDSHKLICEYEDKRQVEPDPKEKLRCQREIESQWTLIQSYLDEYLGICWDFQCLPADIQQIATHFPRYLAEEFKHAYTELRETSPAGKAVSNQLAQLLHRLGHYHARLNELKEAHNLLQECLNPIIVLKGYIEARLDTPDTWSRATSRTYWRACRTSLHKLETFAERLQYTDVPFRRVGGALEGPSWMIEIAVSRSELDHSLKQEDDLETLCGLVEELWDNCYDALYRADKALLDSVGELYLFSTNVLGSVENGGFV